MNFLKNLIFVFLIAYDFNGVTLSENMSDGFNCRDREVYVGDTQISIKERVSNFNSLIKTTEKLKKIEEAKLKKAKTKDKPKITKKINNYKKALNKLKSILNRFKKESKQCTDGLLENFNIIDIGKGFFNGNYNLNLNSQSYSGGINFSFDILAKNSSMVSIAMDNQLASILGLNFAAFSISLDQSTLSNDSDSYEANLWTEGSKAVVTRTSSSSFTMILNNLNLGGATANMLSINLYYQKDYKELYVEFNSFDSNLNLIATGTAVATKN